MPGFAVADASKFDSAEDGFERANGKSLVSELLKVIGDDERAGCAELRASL